jgi:hypothetical protein
MEFDTTTSDSDGLKSEIAQTWGELAFMRNTLAGSEAAWAVSDFALIPNPVAASLNGDIRDYEALLNRLERALAIWQQ